MGRDRKRAKPARSEPKASEVGRDCKRAKPARSEPKASEVGRDCKRAKPARSEPKASEVGQRIEVEFFKMLNRVVEPMVRAGLGSPRLAPGGLIVLEHTGRSSGAVRRSPLAATRLGRHVVVGTYRGDRSQWVKNLAAKPATRYWAGGRAHPAKAFVMHAGKRFREPRSLPAPIRRVARFLAPYTKAGWAFAVLSPRAEKRA